MEFNFSSVVEGKAGGFRNDLDNFLLEVFGKEGSSWSSRLKIFYSDIFIFFLIEEKYYRIRF